MDNFTNNVFEFSNPDNTKCEVWLYERPRVATLVLKINEPQLDINRWIFFDDVDYFYGSMQWIGANFTVLSREEQHSLRMTIGQGDLPVNIMNQLLDNYKLYSVKPTNQDLVIQILARKAKTSSIQYKESDFFARS